MSFDKKLRAITNSSLWSAYGDALGFITELTTEHSLKYRTNVKKVTETVTWTRLIGGKFGTKITLPAGSYSDDTQLRLASSRAIRGDGSFDIEAFAKIELPVWSSYALGAGRGSKEASSSLSKNSFNWFNNFFDTGASIYINGGGNGAAMRIQPHVWVAEDTNKILSFLPDVIKNSICTHGHPRGFAGAAFHAISLADTLSFERALNVNDWLEIANRLSLIYKVILQDTNLSSFWLPMWEELTNTSLKFALKQVTDEVIEDIHIIEKILLLNLEKQDSYFRIVDEIKASTDEHRGSGIKTALLANVLAYLYRDESPDLALTTCVNLLSTDTDSIATMAGALLGAISQTEPQGLIQDKEYIKNEAERLFLISKGSLANSFNYPDLLHWQAPKNALDAVGLVNGRVGLSGISTGEAISDEFYGRSNNDSIWQWIKLDIGQTILCKRRKVLKQLKLSNVPSSETLQPIKRLSPLNIQKSGISNDLFSEPNEKNLPGHVQKNIEEPFDINHLTSVAIKSEFDPKVIGEHIVKLASENRNLGLELSIGYAAIIAKAIIARSKSN